MKKRIPQYEPRTFFSVHLTPNETEAYEAGKAEGRRLERTSEKWKAIRCAGQMLSNIAFNLKQSSEIQNEWRESMNEAQTAWDKAVLAFNRRAKPPKRKAIKWSKADEARFEMDADMDKEKAKRKEYGR
jgi:hypothetical protein